MTMKKSLSMLLVLMMVFSLTACGGNNADQQEANNNEAVEQQPVASEQDYDNVGFTKAQRQVIAEEIGITTEGEKVVFMYEVEEGDEVIYFDVYDEFTGTSSRYTDYRFCLNEEAYEGEQHDMVDSYEDLTEVKGDLYLYGSEEADFSWSGSYEDLVAYYDERYRPYNTDYLIVE
ncbi:MAG: hypothetical protein IJA90_08880 [Peptococcaceae bacterium]|nr:hypothetical protein [Peptococcaceae bacterium]